MYRGKYKIQDGPKSQGTSHLRYHLDKNHSDKVNGMCNSKVIYLQHSKDIKKSVDK